MKKAQELKALYTFALRYLARREHSTQELIKKLRTKIDLAESRVDVVPDMILEVIAELTRKNYLSDTRFAESYSRMRANRGYGKLRIQAELKERGIIQDLSQIDIKIDAKKVREKKFGAALPSDLKEKAKQARYLQYKGFSFDEIKRVLNNDDDE